MPLRIAKIWNYFDSAINLTELLLIFSNCNGYGSTLALSALIITRNAHFSSWLFEFFGWMLLYLLLKAKLQRNGKRQERRVRKNMVSQARAEKKSSGDHSKMIVIDEGGYEMKFEAQLRGGSYPAVSVNLVWLVKVFLNGTEIMYCPPLM